MRQRIFVSGPISRGDLGANINQARIAARKLIAAGFAVCIPQLSCYLDDSKPRAEVKGVTHAEWLDCADAWVSVCDAVLRLPGESVGADHETLFAKSQGIPVFYSVERLVLEMRP